MQYTVEFDAKTPCTLLTENEIGKDNLKSRLTEVYLRKRELSSREKLFSHASNSDLSSEQSSETFRVSPLC